MAVQCRRRKESGALAETYHDVVDFSAVGYVLEEMFDGEDHGFFGEGLPPGVVGWVEEGFNAGTCCGGTGAV